MTQIRITRVYKASDPAIMREGARLALQAAAKRLAQVATKTTYGKNYVFEADRVVAALDPEKIIRGIK